MINEQEFLQLKRFRFETRDYPVDYLYRKYKEGGINLSPPYQRAYVWTPKQEYDLIKSIVQGLSIGTIYISLSIETNNATNNYELVDGKQRLTTIFNFLDNCENVELKGRIKKYCLTVCCLPDYKDYEIRDVYNRLNFNGTPHKESERA